MEKVPAPETLLNNISNEVGQRINKISVNNDPPLSRIITKQLLVTV